MKKCRKGVKNTQLVIMYGEDGKESKALNDVNEQTFFSYSVRY